MIKDIQQFIKSIFKKAGMENLPKKFLDEYEEKLILETQRRLGILMVKELNEEGVKAFDKLMRKNPNPDQKTFSEFFNAYIPNFEEITEKGLRDFEQEFIVELAQLKQSVNKG
ncbi:MAG: DUF5663 domain-containing protein [Patescibacteria group bacterium]